MICIFTGGNIYTHLLRCACPLDLWCTLSILKNVSNSSNLRDISPPSALWHYLCVQLAYYKWYIGEYVQV